MKVLFRVDANPKIGIGHAVRCFALAEAVQERQGEVVFVMKDCPNLFEEWLEQGGIRRRSIKSSSEGIEDAQTLDDYLKAEEADWLVVDGYHFQEPYWNAISSKRARRLAIDDYGHCDRYGVDIVLNPNPYGDVENYRARLDRGEFVGGAEWVLLRKSFRADFNREKTNKIRRVLVTLGGADEQNWTQQVLSELERYPGVKVDVVVGPSHAHCDSLHAWVLGRSKQFRWCGAVTNMSELMASADVGIGSAGVTAWEFSAMGLPGLLIASAKNQEGNADVVECKNLFLVFRALTEETAGLGFKIDTMFESYDFQQSRRLREVIDGLGAPRVVDRMEELLKSSTFPSLRNATLADADRLLLWRNDSRVRGQFFNSDPVLLEAHVGWLRQLLQDPLRFLKILETPEGSCGCIRAEWENGGYDLSWTVAPEFWGKGLGSVMLKDLMEELPGPFRARIKADNVASIRIAEKCGMQRVEETGETVVYAKEKGSKR